MGADRMQLGMVGLGRMGANVTRRAMRDGHDCVVYNRSPDPVRELAGEGATGTHSLDEFVAALEPPRVAWVMVPAAITGEMVEQLAGRLERGDVIIDGGNSYYRDDIDRAERLMPRGIHYLDIGTSGGVFGLERGYCLMIGGESETVAHLDPLLRSIAPGVQAAPRTPGARGSRRPPNRDTCTVAPPALATSSRWCTTASSTGSWPPSPKD